jgi:hypothetical protein
MPMSDASDIVPVSRAIYNHRFTVCTEITATLRELPPSGVAMAATLEELR